MGNDASLFRKCHISSKPYHLTKQWSLCNANYGSKKLTVFVLSATDDSFDISSWKSIRHPFILQYYDSGLLRGKRCIVTEKVEPLRPILDNITREQLIAGLHDLANALHFLHVSCNLSHNNLSIDSVFVSRQANNAWKIGCLEFVSKPGSETATEANRLLQYKQQYVSTNTLPPEDLSGSVKLLASLEEIHRRDAYSFGLLASEMLASKVPLPKLILDCKHEDPTKRPPFSELLADDFFQKCEFLKIKDALVGFASLSEEEKNNFLDTLVVTLRSLPEDLLAASVIPMLMTSRILMLHPEAKTKIHPYLFVPEKVEHAAVEVPLVNIENFENYVIPVIIKLFFVKNAPLRLILLQYLPYYVHLISREVMLETLFPQLSLGLKDTNDELLAATFNAMGQLVLTFGGDDIVGSRKKLFSNDTPRLGTHANESLKALACKLVASKLLSPPDFQTRSEPDGGEQENETSINSDISVAATTDDLKSEVLESNHSGLDELADGDDWTDTWATTASTPTPVPSEAGSAVAVEGSPPATASKSQPLKLVADKSAKKAVPPKKRWSNPELDITELKIASKPTEVDDMFSQMEPDVKFGKRIDEKRKNITQLKASNGSPVVDEVDAKISPSTSTSSKMFDFNCASIDEEVTGWGDGEDDLGVDED